jgi:mevalonate kinase
MMQIELTFRFSSIRLLLTNTLVPRDTKSLVAGVSAKRLAEPQVVDPILDAIQAISDEARGLLSGAVPVERNYLIKRLEVRLSRDRQT